MFGVVRRDSKPSNSVSSVFYSLFLFFCFIFFLILLLEQERSEFGLKRHVIP